MKTVLETTEGYKQMNTNKPIWLRPPSDVSAEESVEGLHALSVAKPFRSHSIN